MYTQSGKNWHDIFSSDCVIVIWGTLEDVACHRKSSPWPILKDKHFISYWDNFKENIFESIFLS